MSNNKMYNFTMYNFILSLVILSLAIMSLQQDLQPLSAQQVFSLGSLRQIHQGGGAGQIVLHEGGHGWWQPRGQQES